MVTSTKIRNTGVALTMWLLLWGVSSTCQASDVQVRADHQPIFTNKSFRLIFDTEHEVAPPPNFSALEQDFEILDENQSTNFQFINGQRSHKTTWTITLLAKRSGTLHIPSIAFGKKRSPEYSMEVTPEAPLSPEQPDTQAKELFLEVSVKPEKIYVQSQVIYTVRFFRAIEIAEASLTEPEMHAADAVIKKLGDNQNFETNRDGIRYLVVEQRYAIFPQRSGESVIKPIRLEAKTGQRDHFSNGLLEDSFDQGNTVVRRYSATITLTVEPIPISFQEMPWLPAHHLQLEEKWSENPPKFQVGESITRTLSLTSYGLTSAQLPEISEKPSSNLKTYPAPPILKDQQERTGIIGVRQEKMIIVPSQPGRWTLPAIEIPWWNIDTLAQEMAFLPERAIVVAPSPTQPSTPMPTQSMEKNNNTTPQLTKQTEQSVIQEREEKEGREHRHLREPSEREVFANNLTLARTNPQLLTIFFAIGWAGTALTCWIRHHLRHPPDPTHNQRRPTRMGWLSIHKANRQHSEPHTHNEGVTQKLARSLKRACLQNDPETCRSTLLAWAQAHWPEKTLRHLNDVHYLLTAQHEEACSQFFSSSPDKKGEQPPQTSRHIMDQHLSIATLSQEIMRLNQALFSPMPEPWSGKTLWDSIHSIGSMQGKSPKKTEEKKILPPLYS